MKLERYQKFNAMRNAALAFETVRVTSEFGKRIRVVTFKGASLAASVYGDLQLRDFTDVDILVARSELADAKGILDSLGYVTTAAEPATREYHDAIGQCTYRHSASGICVDLHWDLAPFRGAFPFDPAEVWASTRNTILAGASVPTLSWEHTAMLLAAHGTKERWRLLKWVCDFAFLVPARPEIDWAFLLRQCRQRNCSRAFRLAVFMAQELAGISATPNFRDLPVNDSAVRKLASESRGKMLRKETESESAAFVYALRSQDGPWQRLKLVLALATTVTRGDHSAWSHPAPPGGLLRVFRPFRLAWKAIRFLFPHRNVRGTVPPRQA
jgi:hypothetical protein